MSKDEICKNCKYYRSEEENKGLCYRYPPTVVEGVYTTADDSVCSGTYMIYPRVDADSFCGEFKEIK